jgi:hypothetical protein
MTREIARVSVVAVGVWVPVEPRTRALTFALATAAGGVVEAVSRLFGVAFVVRHTVYD